MPEQPGQWLIERGIGETRALLIENDTVVAAKLFWPGELRAGDLLNARLISKPKGARRGVAALETGREIFVDHLPADVTEGQSLSVRITRAGIAERERFKHPQGRCVTDAPSSAPSQSRQDFPDAREIAKFEAGLWEEVWHAASSGSIPFAGGDILCSATPAMTVIDIDGAGDARGVGQSASPAIARALRWFDIGGNIGIDFPTPSAKSDRHAVDDALATALGDWRHERTAMNGFGFVQIVARLEGPSLLHRFATSRVGLCTRLALRIGERAQGTGPTLVLSVHPALKAKLKQEWIEELARRTGKQVRIETNPGLALEAPQAQILDL
ncbi:MAG: ribonuclease [Pseudomonadota bacterium]